MKIKITIFSLLLAFIAFVADFSFSDAHSYSSGPPAGYTGSPGDGMSCTSCHGGSPITLTGIITSNIPTTGYVPGTTYSLTVTLTAAGINRFGFQVSPQTAAGTQVGTLVVTNSSQTQLMGGGKYVEHTFAGTSGSGSKTWTFNWIAPAGGSGNFSFYGAFNLANNSGTSSGDQIRVSQLAITEDINPVILVSTKANTTCNGLCDGTITPAATGGVPPYNFTITPGDSANSLCAGTYTVLATDNSGRSDTQIVVISQPSTISSNLSVNNSSCGTCNDGSITASISGGSPPYTQNWTPGSPSNVGPGTYHVTITDGNGCQKNDSAVIGFDALTSTISHTTNLCNGDSNATATVSPAGGTPPYTYTWTPTGQASPTISNLTAGTYSVLVTDANGVTHTSSTTITDPSAVASTHNTTMASCMTCNDGSADLTVAGGTPTYTFVWSNGATSEDLSGVVPGIYTVTVTDGNGCTKEDTVTITSDPTTVRKRETTAFKVFPNPNTGSIQIESNLADGTPYIIYDVTGKQVMRGTLSHHNKLDLSGLESGFYKISAAGYALTIIKQ